MNPRKPSDVTAVVIGTSDEEIIRGDLATTSGNTSYTLLARPCSKRGTKGTIFSSFQGQGEYFLHLRVMAD